MGRKIKQLEISIDIDNVKSKMNQFKKRLTYTMTHPEESSAFDAETIRIILEDLDDVSRNILLVHFGACDADYNYSSQVFNCSKCTLQGRIEKILKYIKEHNDTPKTTYNLPRDSDYC